MSTRTDKTMELLNKIKVDPINTLWYRNTIIEENIRLVPHVLKKYKPYTDDQYQAGCMGLILAVDKFNDSLGVPFHNFACFCIEREIHKQHRIQKNTIENVFAENMVYLDSSLKMKDDEIVSLEEIIADIRSEDAFNDILNVMDLDDLFNNYIIPCVESFVNKNKGPQAKVNKEDWKALELRYIFELSGEQSSKARLNLSKMGKILGLSTQNVKNKHQAVMYTLKKILEESGYSVN